MGGFNHRKMSLNRSSSDMEELSLRDFFSSLEEVVSSFAEGSLQSISAQRVRLVDVKRLFCSPIESNNCKHEGVCK